MLSLKPKVQIKMIKIVGNKCFKHTSLFSPITRMNHELVDVGRGKVLKVVVTVCLSINQVPGSSPF